ncbi:MAG: AAA family ATPase [Bacteriovoracaceae bacterium]|jgi:ATP-dependent Clp protease ATP-binding subunit ClpA|nr:AAA family ATPase [Bacteriovoracaceae bacterium]
MISTKLEILLNVAIKKANELKHEFLTIENVLLALLRNDVVKEALKKSEANLEILKSDLETFVHTGSNFSILTDQEITQLGDEQFANDELREIAKENGIHYQPEISMSLQRVIQRAALHVQSSGKKEILPINLLVAFFSAKDSHGVFFLKKQGVTKEKLVEVIAHSLDKPTTDSNEEFDPLENEDTNSSSNILAKYTTNLNELAKDSKLDPLIGRSKEVERLIQVLCRKKKNNPILVGEAGVGKTAIAEGLAYLINKGKVPQVIKDARIFSLDIASLIAGTKFRGDFEERLKSVINAFKKESEKTQTFLFIDEIHNIIGAGSTNAGSMDASNLLKPALSRGELKCIGSTTYDEFRKFFEKDTALSRRFQKIDVKEPTISETKAILMGAKTSFESFHNVIYSQEVIDVAIKLADKHINDRKMPDKAIDVLDEVGSYLKVKNNSGDVIEVKIEDIEKVVAKIARIPQKSISTNEKDKLKNLNRDLSLMIYGQDKAIDSVCNAILLSRSGINDDQKPIASFLFAGPTGVGKTELAKQLAHILGINFIRFDMSEYMEKHSVAKLIGAPPGYVGNDQGGILTEKISQTPYSVLLLDELEKAHPDIFNILLQVMDHGTLTDSNGKVVDFKNVILIMTSNAGAKDMESGSIGLASARGFNTVKRDQTIKSFFTPEFRNRLDEIIHFNHLASENISSIVEKFVFELETSLNEKNIEIEVQKDAIDWFVLNGYDLKMGARPLKRLIDDRLKKPLSREILFGKLENGGKVLVKVEKNDVKVCCEALKEEEIAVH